MDDLILYVPSKSAWKVVDAIIMDDNLYNLAVECIGSSKDLSDASKLFIKRFKHPTKEYLIRFSHRSVIIAMKQVKRYEDYFDQLKREKQNGLSIRRKDC
ncbi:hypothetical protein [Proteus mirabilis]|uniref:hypothetical protein n=1 Tax=Proteus mirabilis TaxID=584 RepID=UPI0034D3C03F